MRMCDAEAEVSSRFEFKKHITIGTQPKVLNQTAQRFSKHKKRVLEPLSDLSGNVS